MRYALALTVSLFLLAACGDASDLEAEPTETTESADVEAAEVVTPVGSESVVEPTTAVEPAAPVVPATAPTARTTEQCRERAVEVASWGYGSAMPQHTFAFATSRDPGACFIPLDQSADASSTGLYPYTLQVDEGGEIQDLVMTTMPQPGDRIVAVGAEDVNDDGTEDLFVVHAARGADVALLSDGGGWTQGIIGNGEAGIFVETVAELIEFWKNPVFPP
ncbi:hypothetical protein [Rubrivirga sp.]|uniref:hypothetical protein n=1 Tax=Rubrivirga sp. TaxID=1885344 RepID=UPI003C71A3BF